MMETEIGNRVTYSITLINIVMEQRVDGSCGNSTFLIHIRFTLMSLEIDYYVSSHSK